MANPVLKLDSFSGSLSRTGSNTMTVEGTTNKAFLLFLLLMVTTSYTWQLYNTSGIGAVYPLLAVGSIGAFVLALVLSFNASWSPFLAPAYALLEGLVIGGISAFMEQRFPDIVFQAVGLTLAAMLSMLVLYRTGIIRATEKFKSVIMVSTMAIALVYLVSFILSFFQIQIPFMHGNGVFSIAFSLFVVGIAALNLILDFDFVEEASRYNSPKYMEWYGAFGLMVTLIWLYIEILNLLAKLRSDD